MPKVATWGLCSNGNFCPVTTQPPASTNKEPKDNERACITASLMALGTNIGLKKMEQAVKGISYKQMSNIVNWRMSDDNMEKAMAEWWIESSMIDSGSIVYIAAG